MDITNQEKQFNTPVEQENMPIEEQGEVLATPENQVQPVLEPEPEAQPSEQPSYQETADQPEVEIHQKVEHLAPLPKEEQLWQLKLIARDSSLEKAIAIAKKLNDPWLEDKFHDDLMDDPELRAQLEVMGKLERL